MIEHLVFLLEGESERDFLELLLPRVLPPEIEPHFMVFEGKQDLEKNVVPKLKRWLRPNSQFVVMRDQDSGDCHVIKAGLRKKYFLFFYHKVIYLPLLILQIRILPHQFLICQ